MPPKDVEALDYSPAVQAENTAAPKRRSHLKKIDHVAYAVAQGNIEKWPGSTSKLRAARSSNVSTTPVPATPTAA